MGTYIKGINGRFTGKVGSTVGSQWKGISVMKSLPDFSNHKASKKQLAHRAKFRLATKFLQPLYPVIQLGFKNQDSLKSPQNAAMSELMKYTIEGEYPDYKVNLNNLVLAVGSLKGTNRPSVEANGEEVVFTWRYNASSDEMFKDNGVILVAIAEGYYPEYTIGQNVRSEGTASMYLPDAPPGTVVHCYIAFAAMDDTNRVSNSVHAGTVIIPEEG
ncbi:DUF6266 family protein [Plebeiibacterium sediminum]|uniref:DUF6266 family protein n=1 Tax=Plebeiibacterium sediminum TaxID=2992112 RepID=A0AAE3SHY0_9BACT|nr:DUF6266 family protein [Plebeiobacterium sediminum]MCW3789752.1 DUF6266 family protein [Plebeiobacterium sediminum]